MSNTSTSLKNKMTKLAKRDLVALVLSLSAKSRRRKICFCHDRILSAKKPRANQKSYQSALLPYTTFVTIFLSRDTRSDAELIEHQDRMWINIERVAASRAKGTCSYGGRVDLSSLGSAEIGMENNDIGAMDRWRREDIKRAGHETLKALLLAFGNTTILSRNTYFPADQDELLTLSMKTFLKLDDVFCLRVGSNFRGGQEREMTGRELSNGWRTLRFRTRGMSLEMHKAMLRNQGQQVVQAGNQVSIQQQGLRMTSDERRATSSGRVHRLKDCIDSAVASVGPQNEVFSYRLVADSRDVRKKFFLAVVEDDRPTVALAIEVGDKEEVVMSGTVVMDSPSLFVEMGTEERNSQLRGWTLTIAQSPRCYKRQV